MLLLVGNQSPISYDTILLRHTTQLVCQTPPLLQRYSIMWSGHDLKLSTPQRVIFVYSIRAKSRKAANYLLTRYEIMNERGRAREKENH